MSIDKAIRKLNHRRIDLFRALSLQITIKLMKYFNRMSSVDSASSYLVLRFDDKLGDSVTSTGFLKSLKQHKPNTRVSVVAGPSTVDLYRSLDFVDEVFVGRKGLVNTLKLMGQLRSHHFDFLINTSHILNPRTVVVAALVKAFRKLNFESHASGIFTEVISIDFLKDHVTERYRKALQVLGVPASAQDLSYTLAVSERARLDVSKVFQELKSRYEPIIVLNSFAGGKLRNLNMKTTVSLVSELTQKYPQAFIISLANSGDHRILKSWVEKAQINRWICYPEYSSLDHNLALAEKADMMITPDTAWVHLACALKKKLVAIYREDIDLTEINSVIWSPFGTKAKVIFARTERGHEHDINSVKIFSIVSAVQELLDDPRADSLS